MFATENPTVAAIKRAFGMEQQVDKENKLLFGRKLDVRPILEPDEIIWENLAYTGDEQRFRKYIMQFVSLLFLIINTLFTMYLTGIQSWLEREIPSLNYCPDVELTKEEAYKDMMKEFNGDKNEDP